jgi:hypothetical protein
MVVGANGQAETIGDGGGGLVVGGGVVMRRGFRQSRGRLAGPKGLRCRRRRRRRHK